MLSYKLMFRELTGNFSKQEDVAEFLRIKRDLEKRSEIKLLEGRKTMPTNNAFCTEAENLAFIDALSRLPDDFVSDINQKINDHVRQHETRDCRSTVMKR